MKKTLFTILLCGVLFTVFIQNYSEYSIHIMKGLNSVFRGELSDWKLYGETESNVINTEINTGRPKARPKHQRKPRGGETESKGNGKIITSDEKKERNKNGGKPRRNSKGYLIYTCTTRCGGWADRLKGIVTGYILANITNRQFGINITKLPCELTKAVVPNHFNWNLNLTHKQLARMSTMSYMQLDSYDFYRNVQNIDFREKFPPHKKIIQFIANLDYIDQFKQNKFHEKDLYWLKGMSRDQVYAEILEYLLRLSPKSQSRVDEFMKRAKPEKKTKLVCAHIRKGKSATIPSDPVRANDKDVENAWKFLKAYNDSSIYKIFLATDSEVISREAKKLFSKQIVENAGNIVHVDKKKQLETATCDDFRKVVIDQHILSKCDVLLIGFSGYSRYAAYMRGTDKGLYCILRNHSGIKKCEPKTLKELYGVMG